LRFAKNLGPVSIHVYSFRNERYGMLFVNVELSPIANLVLKL
jgi:hypothetical protein